MEFKKKRKLFFEINKIFFIDLTKKNSLRKEFNIYKIQENIIFFIERNYYIFNRIFIMIIIIKNK